MTKLTRSIVAMIALLSLSASSAMACTENGMGGIVPTNNLKIPVGAKRISSVTEADFNETLDKIEKFYSSVIKEKGGILDLKRLWKDPTVNAGARQVRGKWEVYMFGGLARFASMTTEGFTLVACHELGHHIGGAPKKLEANWASNEGQSDYWAVTKCMRTIFLEENNVAIVNKMKIPATVTKECEKSFNDANDRAICARISMGGMALALLYKHLEQSDEDISFSTPDTSVVRRTYDDHPATQCRLDTYFQGALCEVDHQEAVSDSDAHEGSCTKKQNYERGLRPACWFLEK